MLKKLSRASHQYANSNIEQLEMITNRLNCFMQYFRWTITVFIRCKIVRKLFALVSS